MDPPIQEIVISAAGWEKPNDFYLAFLNAVGAPSWHGHNLDALWDSMTSSDINRVNAPYRLRITEINQISEECRQPIERFTTLVRKARAEGTPVELVCEP